jgi:hypothetical protein
MAHTQPHNTGEEVQPQGWTEAFAAKSDDAFGEAFASNIVLEASAFANRRMPGTSSFPAVRTSPPSRWNRPFSPTPRSPTPLS